MVAPLIMAPVRRPARHSGPISMPITRGLHSFTLELNLCNSRTNSRAKSGYTVDRRAQVELNWERV